ncbi:Lrp/AsnC family transcriptional regulator [Candidatus Bathyarchaeota archaeon]|nr:Lrp/AsnC family transcriptional regulator [Candidatus Bathyarchaeota archaeon]
MAKKTRKDITSELDEIDREILSILKRNARTSLSDISIEVGLSSPSISDRIMKLEKMGLIRGYTLVMDYRKLGLGITAFVGVTLEHPQCCRGDVVKELVKIPQITEGHFTDGEEDMLVKVVTEDTASLMEILAKITSINGVNRTKTTIVLSTPIDSRSPEKTL